MIGSWGSFWKTDSRHGADAFRQSILSHLITAKHAAPLMIKKRRGLIVEVTEGDTVFGGGGNADQRRRQALIEGLCGAHGRRAAARIASRRSSITPGFLRSESMLQHFGVTEANWRDGGKKDKNFLESESPLFVGRAVAALAGDPKVLDRSGDVLSSWELAREYGFDDYDGRRPDWGVLFGKIAPSFGFVEPYRRHRAFLERMLRRMDQYLEIAEATIADRSKSASAGKSSRRK